MSNFDRDALRKGTQAIDDAIADAAKKRQGGFKPFLPNIFWRNRDDARYLLFLNPIEEIPEMDFHPFIDVGGDLPESALARTEKSIGESVDPLTKTWGYKPRLTGFGIAAELEPLYTEINGRQVPNGFEVATVEFQRRLRDDDGELTDEYEDVVAPKVGLIAQSPHNFYNQLRSIDATEAPIHQTALKITRLGDNSNVAYHVKAYEGAEVDRTNLLEYFDNLSYVTEPEELLDAIDGKDDEEAGLIIGEYLLYKRLDELADPEHYQAVFEQVDKPSKYGTKVRGKQAGKDKPKANRTSRPSQRTRKQENVEEEVTKESPLDKRMARLRQKGLANSA